MCEISSHCHSCLLQNFPISSESLRVRNQIFPFPGTSLISSVAVDGKADTFQCFPDTFDNRAAAGNIIQLLSMKILRNVDSATLK